MMILKNLKKTQTLLGALAALLLIAQGAAAVTNHGTFAGTNVTYNNVTETSTFGDPEPLFGAPTPLGNQLLFFPSSFSASASGAFGFDQTGAQLQTSITANGPTDVIDTLLLTEFGDTNLTGGGTAATGSIIGISGFVTVTADINGPIAPVVISFSDNPGAAPWVPTSYSPSNVFDLVNDPGTTSFSAGVTIDIASVVPNATSVFFSLDNDLTAYSEAGTGSTIQKKVVSGPAVVIEVIPEPGTALLVGIGLAGLAARTRGRRS